MSIQTLNLLDNNWIKKYPFITSENLSQELSFLFIRKNSLRQGKPPFLFFISLSSPLIKCLFFIERIYFCKTASYYFSGVSK